MIADLLRDKQFQELAKEYKFLRRVNGEPLDSLEYVVLDIETTGLEPTKNEITELGAMKIKGQEIIEIFSTLIKPKEPISAEITRITGIDDEMVKDFPPAKKILPKFFEFLGSAILVAHNTDFDIAFIKHHLKQEANIDLTNETICTVKLARYLLPSLVNHKLHTVGAHFNLPIVNRHRAMGDVEITFQVWLRFIDLLKEQNIANKRDLDLLISRL
ncbi:MAG: exonuclease domain-containing protein [bacterium]